MNYDSITVDWYDYEDLTLQKVNKSEISELLYQKNQISVTWNIRGKIHYNKTALA
ncbi:hypothetical protein ACF0H5_016839 [Mactra antiquata]